MDADAVIFTEHRMGIGYSTFIRTCNIVLGALAGLLISLPLAAAMTSRAGGIGAIIAFTALGALVGRKRGESRAFLYFALVVVSVLASVVSSSLFS